MIGTLKRAWFAFQKGFPYRRTFLQGRRPTRWCFSMVPNQFEDVRTEVLRRFEPHACTRFEDRYVNCFERASRSRNYSRDKRNDFPEIPIAPHSTPVKLKTYTKISSFLSSLLQMPFLSFIQVKETLTTLFIYATNLSKEYSRLVRLNYLCLYKSNCDLHGTLRKQYFWFRQKDLFDFFYSTHLLYSN